MNEHEDSRNLCGSDSGNDQARYIPPHLRAGERESVEGEQINGGNRNYNRDFNNRDKRDFNNRDYRNNDNRFVKHID